uniref:Uncharacterized protein n=1 Tax=Lygus hesperus TaxID=30085 RepID=A0A0A9Y4R7_LYGHE
MNRAACFLHLMDLKRAIEDSTLALTLLANTPASEITQEKYRYLMAKLHARRGAAYGWKEDYRNALSDLKMALAYTNAETEAVAHAAIQDDIIRVSHKMTEKGLSLSDEDHDSGQSALASLMQKAAGLYYQGKYTESLTVYEQVLECDIYHVNARSNYIATLLHCKKFKEALS